MDRAGLLAAVAKAQSAAALGQDDGTEQRRLDGRRFEVRIRFGCPMRTQRDGQPFTLRFSDEDRMLRVRAAPDLTLADPVVAELAGKAIEAVEGFWIPRPWLLADGCPVGRPPPIQPTGPKNEAAPEEIGTRDAPEGRTDLRVGIAQFFTAADARTARRDSRAYEATKELGENERPSPQGYNFILSGRLRQLSAGRVIPCRVVSPDLPPECVVSAVFDRVWVAAPGSKDVLAEWGR